MPANESPGPTGRGYARRDRIAGNGTVRRLTASQQGALAAARHHVIPTIWNVDA